MYIYDISNLRVERIRLMLCLKRQVHKVGAMVMQRELELTVRSDKFLQIWGGGGLKGKN